MFLFTPLLGAQQPSPASQSLLELDAGIKILVDVGWDESFDGSKLQELEKHVPTLSIVLLTHATIEHVGAYAHCCKHVPGFSRIPVYATTPVINLGRTLVIDLYGGAAIAASIIPQESILSSPVASNAGDAPQLLLQPPTPDEIATYFALINPLKYHQPHQPIPSPFSPSLSGLSITAYSAGHSLGGTIWHIQHGLESIVYAADWNLARENFFPGAAWLSSGNQILEPLHRPTAFICSSRGVERQDVQKTSDRNETLVTLIRETIAQGGQVLIPTDSSARVLELAFLLNNVWRENMDGPHSDTYRNTRIYMASKSSSATIRYLQSMLEWMDDAVTRSAEAAITKGEGQKGAINPLDWRYIRQVKTKAQVEKALNRSRPCIMLASDTSLEWGLSKDALELFAADSRNLVILTETTARADSRREGVALQLWQIYSNQTGQQSSQSKANIVNTNGIEINLQDITSSDLSREEDLLYQQYLERQRQMHSTLQGDNTTNDVSVAEVGEDQASESESSDDEEEETEHQGRALNVSAQLTQNKHKVGAVADADIGVNILLRSNSMHDYDVRHKRGREKMFPFMVRKTRDDEFGDLIKPEDFLRAEERDDGEALDEKAASVGKAAGAVGHKRKWDDTASGSDKKAQSNKRSKNEPKKERKPDGIDDAIARITGQASDGTPSGELNGTGDESSEEDESEYEPDEAPSGPQKAVFSTRSLKLSLRLAYVDFSGLYSLTDVRNLIGNINPRKLIVIAGNASETKELAETCRSADEGKAVQGEIFTPALGESVDASVDTNAWTVKLSRQLLKRLRWAELAGGLNVVSVTGRLDSETVAKEEDGGQAAKKAKLPESSEASASAPADAPPIDPTPVLDVLPIQQITKRRAAQPVHVGDLRLAQIREAVQALGHTAELRGGGTLLIDGTVLVRKSQTSGGIEVESANQGLSLPNWPTQDKSGRRGRDGTFFAVKQVIYDKLAVVGA